MVLETYVLLQQIENMPLDNDHIFVLFDVRNLFPNIRSD